jgi:nucleoside-diphosphate-sugar epimerase
MSVYLVTGGAGFIGSNITDELVKQGHKVRVLDNLSTGKMRNLDGVMDEIDFVKGDIRNEEDLEKALEGVDLVLHQAALRSVARSVEDPLSSNDVNISGTLALLLKAKEFKVKRLVYASSSSVYGEAASFPQKESFAPAPISPYAVSKLSAEYYCRMFSATMGLETVSLRYFNVFGPRQDPESKYSAVIPAFIDNLAKGNPCVIHGDGEQSRDFTFVKNVVDANIQAATASGVSGGVFNVACGEEHSVKELASKLMELMDTDMPLSHVERRRGDVDRTFADVSRLKEVLGVKDQVSFEKGLKRTVEWFLNEREDEK